MTFRSKPVLVTLALGMSVAVHAQTLPYDAQFHRLLGEPTETVSALLTYPWKDNIQISPPGLNNISHGELIRIVSAERPVSAYDRWSHWTNSDGTVWVDVVDFSSKTGAAELLSSADQPYSGYHWENQLLLFSNLCDPNKDAIGTAFISPAGQLVNIGIKLERAASRCLLQSSELMSVSARSGTAFLTVQNLSGSESSPMLKCTERRKM